MQRDSLKVIEGDADAGRMSLVPVKDGKPDFDSAPVDLRADYAEFAPAAKCCTGYLRFRASPNRVEYLAPVEEDKRVIGFEWRRLCGGLILRAAVRDDRGESHGVFCELHDINGEVKRLAIPREIIGKSPADLAGLLSSAGLDYAPRGPVKQRLAEYLHDTRLREVWRCTERVGWHGETFVFPDECMTPKGGETVVYQSSTGRSDGDALLSAGTLQEWQDSLAAPLAGNPRGVFSICAALAAPLLTPLDVEGGGFHFRGGSSSGKTTLLHIAGSVWGGGPRPYVQTWRATDNGLEAVASAHNSLLLCLDELGQVEPGAANKTAYMLANGIAKVRASRNGGARSALTWRVLFLSTGEISLADKMREDSRGPRTMAGQETRIADIPADAGQGMGVWNVTPKGMKAKDLSDAMKAAAVRYYGTAGRAFVRRLVDERADVVQVADEFIAGFLDGLDLDSDDGQIHRVAKRMALVASAGEIAIRWGILPYSAGEAVAASRAIFTDWRAGRGGDANSETRDHVAAIRRFIERHGAARFERLHGFDGGGPDKVINRAGWRRADDLGGALYLFHNDGWAEACAGIDPKEARKTLAARGFIADHDADKLTKNVRTPDGQSRVTVISGSILDAE